MPVIKPHGDASRYQPIVKAAFVRRKGEYGLRWPGAVYDGEAAKMKYTENLNSTAKLLNIKLDIKELPLYSPDEADAWLQEVKAAHMDGIIVLRPDRQEHAWPTAQKASETGIPLVVFSPLGTFSPETIRNRRRVRCWSLQVPLWKT